MLYTRKEEHITLSSFVYYLYIYDYLCIYIYIYTHTQHGKTERDVSNKACLNPCWKISNRQSEKLASLGIMGDTQLRAPLKPFNTVVL